MSEFWFVTIYWEESHPAYTTSGYMNRVYNMAFADIALKYFQSSGGAKMRIVFAKQITGAEFNELEDWDD